MRCDVGEGIDGVRATGRLVAALRICAMRDLGQATDRKRVFGVQYLC